MNATPIDYVQTKRSVRKRTSFRISVAVCTYNGEQFISDQLQSILQQTRPPDEIIICDDCSIDNTKLIVQEIMEQSKIPWRMIENATNLGVNKNFEQALISCSGDLICTADQDDYWFENKLAMIECTFDSSPETLLVFSNGQIVNDRLEPQEVSLWDIFGFNPQIFMYDQSQFFSLLLKRNVVTGATMVIHRKLLAWIIPFSDSWFFDHWIAMMATSLGCVKVLPEKTMYYRVHGNNVVGAVQETLLYKVKRYLSNYSKDYLMEYRRVHFTMLSQLHLRCLKIIASLPDSIDIGLLREIEVCMNFWKRRVDISHEPVLKSLWKVTLDFKAGKYHKYHTGVRGAIRDVIRILF